MSANPIEPAVRPLAWSTERFLALVESGIIPEGRGIELIAGQVIETMPQGEIHWFMFSALQSVFARMGAFSAGLRVQPTIVLVDDHVVDPEFAFLRPEALCARKLPMNSDVLHIIEVSVSSLAQDLGPKMQGYAASNIPLYWVVDGIDRGVWVFTEPTGGIYGQRRFYPQDARIEVPLLGSAFHLQEIFPPQP